MKNILFVAPFAGPPYIEAWRNNIKVLSELLNAKVIATSISRNQLNNCPSNFSFVVHRNKYFRYILHTLRVKQYAKHYDVIFLELLPYSIYFFLFLFILNRKKCIYRLIGSELFDNSRKKLLKKIFLSKYSKSLGNLVVPDSRTMQKFADESLSTDNIIIVKPGIDLNRFKWSKPNNDPNFKLLMASAPMVGYPWFTNWKEAFHNKGILILLDAIEQLKKTHEIILTLVWRGDFYNEILDYIKKKNLNCVNVVNETVDIYEYYKNNDATILPACTAINTPLYPNSIMESISVGRPVIISKFLHISDTINDSKCGISIEPNVNELIGALEDMIIDYKAYQSRCLFAAKEYFDFSKNVAEFKEILSVSRIN